jgi:hypothetical protein
MSFEQHAWVSGGLTYGITPPKLSYSEERRRATAAAQAARISALPVTGLVVYDLQDESSRTDVARPFPFLQSIDSLDYAFDYLAEVPQQKIVYRSVSGQGRAELAAWLNRLAGRAGATVLVGAPSREQKMSLRLSEAYGIHRAAATRVPLGGVLIAERHETHGGEDERALRKVDHGCEFFISQAVYAVTASKNLLSDLYYRCQAEERSMPTVLVTLSPCGSEKTLAFMRWLGVSVPAWLSNELVHAHDILEKSVDVSLAAFEELYEFAASKGIPLGCNVESVSLRKAEIDASVDMVHRVAKILGRGEDQASR